MLVLITPETARDHHVLLRDLLAREVEYPRRDGQVVLPEGDDNDYYENLYWVAFLLYCVGDPSDTPALYRAKYTNFDTGCGLDVQNLFGAGVEPTFAFLRAQGHREMAEDLEAYTDMRKDLDGWAQYTREYFYRYRC